MKAVRWWDHSRVWLEEYDQSLKYMQEHEHEKQVEMIRVDTFIFPAFDQQQCTAGISNS